MGASEVYEHARWMALHCMGSSYTTPACRREPRSRAGAAGAATRSENAVAQGWFSMRALGGGGGGGWAAALLSALNLLLHASAQQPPSPPPPAPPGPSPGFLRSCEACLTQDNVDGSELRVYGCAHTEDVLDGDCACGQASGRS